MNFFQASLFSNVDKMSRFLRKKAKGDRYEINLEGRTRHAAVGAGLRKTSKDGAPIQVIQDSLRLVLLLIDSKFRRSGVLIRDSSSKRITNLCNLSQIVGEAKY